MKEKSRRVLFLFIFALALLQIGGHVNQRFVNYAAWKFISIDSFPAYHQEMAEAARNIAAIPRLVEVVMATVVLCYCPTAIKRWMLGLAIVFALCALLSTIFVQRPIHVQLGAVGNTPELLSRLMATDWFRLIAEWLRGALYLWMMLLLVRQGPQADAQKTGRTESGSRLLTERS